MSRRGVWGIILLAAVGAISVAVGSVSLFAENIADRREILWNLRVPRVLLLSLRH